MLKKWFEIITDHRISLRERMFRIVTGVCMIAIAFTLPMGRSVWNILMLVVSLAAMGVIVRISIRKQQIHTGATVIAVLLLTLFPVTFFSAGGFYSGVPEWFVLCFIYVCITLQGRRRIVFFGLCTVETMLCYGTAYYFPEITMPGFNQNALFDSAFSMIMVGLLTSVLLMFLSRMYEEENALSQRQKKEIEELNRAENHFFSSMSHEIRTPINTICGMSEIVLREDLNDTVRSDVFSIQTAGRSLLSIVSDVLDFSELQSGKMSLAQENYNITSTVNDLINMAAARRSGKKIELVVDCDAGLPSGLYGDEQKIRRVIMNLVDNALKFTAEGGVSIVISCRRTDYGINLIICVKDTGLGINEECQEKLFTRFNQADARRNRQESGIGLGLAISQAMVDKMGGFIMVSSKPGRGSEFQVVIPQKVTDDTPIAAVRDPKRLHVAVYIDMEQFDRVEIRDEYGRRRAPALSLRLERPFPVCSMACSCQRICLGTFKAAFLPPAFYQHCRI